MENNIKFDFKTIYVILLTTMNIFKIMYDYMLINLSIIVLYKIAIQEHIECLMKLLIMHSLIQKLTPSIRINKHFLTS